MIFLTIRGPSLTCNRRPSDTCKHGGGGHPGYLQAVVNQADVFLGESKRPAAHIEVVTSVPASLHDATSRMTGDSFDDMRDLVNQHMCHSGSIQLLSAAHIEVVTSVPASLHDATSRMTGDSFDDMRDLVNQHMCHSGSIQLLHAPASFPAFRCLTRRECLARNQAKAPAAGFILQRR